MHVLVVHVLGGVRHAHVDSCDDAAMLYAHHYVPGPTPIQSLHCQAVFCCVLRGQHTVCEAFFNQLVNMFFRLTCSCESAGAAYSWESSP